VIKSGELLTDMRQVMAKYVGKAQRCIEDPVLAAAAVQASGATGAALGGWAILGALGFAIAVRIHRRAQRRTSGLPLSPYMLLAVTADRLYLLEAGSTWRGKRVISVWDRDDLEVTIDPGSFVYRFGIRLDETRTLTLGGRRGTGAADVAELLRKESVEAP
jgi:hypothetical protein